MQLFIWPRVDIQLAGVLLYLYFLEKYHTVNYSSECSKNVFLMKHVHTLIVIFSLSALGWHNKDGHTKDQSIF